MANRSISLCRCVNIAYYMDDCFFSKSGGEGKRKEKERKTTEGGEGIRIAFSWNSDSNLSRGENDSRVNLAD